MVCYHVKGYTYVYTSEREHGASSDSDLDMSAAVAVLVGVLGGSTAAIFLVLRLYRLPKFPKTRVDAFLEKACRGPVAHRGGVPENTLRAFRLSKSQGASGIEVDLTFSKDGHPVLLHDATVDRTASNGSGQVAELTLQQLKQLDVGSKFGCSRYNAHTKTSLIHTLHQLGQSLLGNKYRHWMRLWMCVKNWI